MTQIGHRLFLCWCNCTHPALFYGTQLRNPPALFYRHEYPAPPLFYGGEYSTPGSFLWLRISATSHARLPHPDTRAGAIDLRIDISEQEATAFQYQQVRLIRSGPPGARCPRSGFQYQQVRLILFGHWGSPVVLVLSIPAGAIDPLTAFPVGFPILSFNTSRCD